MCHALDEVHALVKDPVVRHGQQHVEALAHGRDILTQQVPTLGIGARDDEGSDHHRGFDRTDHHRRPTREPRDDVALEGRPMLA